jgi:hypothetical protein
MANWQSCGSPFEESIMPCSGQRLGSCAVLALLVLISNFGSSIARSDTIAYTNFGPDHSYNTLIGVTVDPSVSSGAQFISTATGTLSEIVAAIVWNAAQASTSFTLNIYDDNANTLGALLGSFSGTAGPSGSVAHLVLPSSGIDLTSGRALTGGQDFLLASRRGQCLPNPSTGELCESDVRQSRAGPCCCSDRRNYAETGSAEDLQEGVRC